MTTQHVFSVPMPQPFAAFLAHGLTATYYARRAYHRRGTVFIYATSHVLTRADMTAELYDLTVQCFSEDFARTLPRERFVGFGRLVGCVPTFNLRNDGQRLIRPGPIPTIIANGAENARRYVWIFESVCPMPQSYPHRHPIEAYRNPRIAAILPPVFRIPPHVVEDMRARVQRALAGGWQPAEERRAWRAKRQHIIDAAEKETVQT